MRGKLGKKERQAELLHRKKRAQAASGLAPGGPGIAVCGLPPAILTPSSQRLAGGCLGGLDGLRRARRDDRERDCSDDFRGIVCGRACLASAPAKATAR